MRTLLVSLFTAGFAFSAFAQQTVSPNNVPTTNALPQPVNAAAPTNAIVKTKPVEPELQEIGYDPKVKRDPRGRALDESATKVMPATESQKLRKDVSSTMRSDVRKPVEVPAIVQPLRNVREEPAGATAPNKAGVNNTESNQPKPDPLRRR